LQPGRPFSRSQAAHGFGPVRYPHLIIGLRRERAELFGRIELRCRRMFAQGLVEEVRSLLAAGVNPAAKSLGSLGYAQVVKMLAGEYDQAGALDETIKRTKAFAKRQLTWFNKVPAIKWHHPGEAEAIGARVARWWEKE
jgi:tRNA dimethylallyltransferase